MILGFLAKITGMFSLEELKRYVRDYFANDKIYEANVPAMERGFNEAE